jgi:hypothetical protein
MAKLIYETDAGHQVTVSLAESLITELEELHQIDAWAEILHVLKQEILAANEIKEAAYG